MYRVIAIVAGGLTLAACSTSGWLSLDAFKPKPAMETVRFESVPPGAEVRLPNGQSCMTPCAYPLEANGSYAITYSLTGYQPASETIAPMPMGDGTTQLRPNPVTVELAPIAPPKPKKKTPRRHTVKKKTVKPPPKPSQPAATPNPAPAAMAPPPQQAPSPWPPAQPPQH